MTKILENFYAYTIADEANILKIFLDNLITYGEIIDIEII